MTTDQQQPDAAAPEPEQGDHSGETQQPSAAVATYRDPYDTAEPVTLRDRIIYARELANSGLLPRDYVGKPANVLVAAELGSQMGLAPIQAVLLLNVVEGKPSLGANGVRAVVARAGHHMGAADVEYNRYGIPTQASVTGWRTGEEDRAVTVTWSLDRAARAGLCTLRRNEAGEIVEVRARSSQGKVLPWEAYTEDMLDARATVKLGRTLFGDVTMGLSYEREELQDAPVMYAEQVAQPKTEPSARAQEVLQQVKPQRRTDLPDDYMPAADLALFNDVDGGWWNDAGAQVSRRNARQLAADRIAKWVADNPDQDVVPLPPTTEPMEDGGADPDGTDVVDAVLADDQTMDPNDPDDPWAKGPGDDQVDDVRLADGSVVPGPDDDPVAAEPVTDAPPADVLGDDGPDLGAPMTAPTAEELLAEIDQAATRFGKSRQGLMVRWIATHRKNPEEATAEELLPFVRNLRETISQMQG